MQRYNLVVVGGGLSGVAAAVSAAREGLKVLIIEQSGCFGGAISNNLVFPFMKHWRTDENGERELLSRGLFSEMKRRQDEKIGGCNDRTFAPEYFKMVLDDMILDSGVDYLFYTTAFEVQTDGSRIKAIKVLAKSTVLTVEADFFIDATGDGDVFALAGCDFQLGRENDGLCQPMTTCFRSANVDVEGLYKEKETKLNALYKELQDEGKIRNPRENLLFMRGIDDDVMHFNTTRVLHCDPTDAFDLSRAEIEARKQVYEMDSFLREHSQAYKKGKIVSMSTKIGVRESRKLKGLHILTGEEIKNCVHFEDSIACANYDLDIHSPDGSGTYIYVFKGSEYYTIPYRSLLPKEYVNLVVAGRCLSATHEAHSAVRIMSTCACMGEAAGCAVGVAFNTGANAHTVDIQAVRKKLTDYGARV